MGELTSPASGITIYKYTLHPSLLLIARYGLSGGALMGLLLHLPAHLILRALLDTPLTFLQLDISFMVYGLLLIAQSLGLLLTIFIWRKRQSATGLRRTTVGVLIGVFYTLASYLSITSGVLAVIAYRWQLPNYYEIYGFPIGMSFPITDASYITSLLSYPGWAWFGSLLLIMVGWLGGRFWLPVAAVGPAVPVRETTIGYLLPWVYALVPLAYTVSYTIVAAGDPVSALNSVLVLLPMVIVVQGAVIIHMLGMRTPHRTMLGEVYSFSFVWGGAGLILEQQLFTMDWPEIPSSIPMIKVLGLVSILFALAIMGLTHWVRRRTRETPTTVRLLINPAQLRWSGAIAAFIAAVIGLMTWQVVPLFIAAYSYLNSPFAGSSIIIPKTLPVYLDLWLMMNLHGVSAASLVTALALLLLAFIYVLPRAFSLTNLERKGYNCCSHCDRVSHMGETFCPYCGLPFTAEASSSEVRAPGMSPNQIKRWRVYRMIGAMLLGFLIMLAGLLSLLPSSQITGPSLPLPSATPIEYYSVVALVQDVPAGDTIPLEAVQAQYRIVPFQSDKDRDLDGVVAPGDEFVWDIEEVIGRRAMRDLYRGEYVSSSMLLPGGFAQNDIYITPMPVTMPGESKYPFPIHIYQSGAKSVLNEAIWWDEWAVTIAPGLVETTVTAERMEGDLQPVVMVWSVANEKWMDGNYTSNPQMGRAVRRMMLPPGAYIVVVTRSGETSGSYSLSIE